MTPALRKAFAKAATLPGCVQDMLAGQLLEDIEDELKWDHTLASPKSRKLLDRLAAQALKDKRLGKVHGKGIDEL